MKTIWIGVLLVMFCGAVSAAGYDWTKPETIDINDSGLVENFDVHPEKFMAEGWKAYQNKEYEKATRYYLAYVHQVKNDSLNLYNLACCYGLLGKADQSAAWLTRAIEAGWTDIEHINKDPDFQSVRDSDGFKKVVAGLQAKLDKEKFDPGRMIMLPSRCMIPMYVKLPEGFDAEKTYPLVVGLHGFGDQAKRFTMIWEDRELSGDFIYVAMEAPYGFVNGKEIGYSWFLRMDPAENRDLMYSAGEMTVGNVLAGIEQLKKEYKIDRVFLTGFSQGAGLTYIAGLKNPGLFAGIAPMGGWLDTDVITEDDLKASKTLPVLIIHGTGDTMVEYESATKAEQILKDHGFSVRLLSFEGGHTVPVDGLKALKEMIFGSQKEM